MSEHDNHGSYWEPALKDDLRQNLLFNVPIALMPEHPRFVLGAGDEVHFPLRRSDLGGGIPGFNGRAAGSAGVHAEEQPSRLQTPWLALGIAYRASQGDGALLGAGQRR
ncbi:MAG: hypothetical protein ACR2LH_03005 [Thermoleophilaceae bacterium]